MIIFPVSFLIPILLLYAEQAPAKRDMKLSKTSISLKITLRFFLLGVILSTQLFTLNGMSALASATDTVCRFGITSPTGSEGYNIASLGIGSYLDWGAASNPSLPEGIEYIRVLRVRDDVYPDTLAKLPGWIDAYPGSVWVVGNEPDTKYENQDALTAEVYADRFYQLARIIRTSDSTARTAFGSIVQPTPIRLRYLDRAWTQLVARAGSEFAARQLIDMWSIHSFILNEQPGSWGTGVPPGFEYDFDDAIIITDLADTYNIDIFKERINAFRSWLADKGMRDKPLWITEYGSLLPPIDPPGGPPLYHASDADTSAFMVDSFNFMLSATDDQTGLPADGNLLVQRWFWYSLNDHRYNFGGTLFDPDNNKQPTLVGANYIDYQAAHLQAPDLYPENLAIAPVSYNHDRTRVNYRLDITIGNVAYPDASCAQVWVYDGDPNNGGQLIAGPLPSSMIHSDYGNGRLTAYWNNVVPLTNHLIYVRVEAIGVADTDPSNNLASYLVFTDLPKLEFLPVVNR